MLLLTGASGRSYRYDPFPMHGAWVDRPGNYAFGCPPRQSLLDPWTVFYIGIADSLQQRFRGHERWEEARRLGATHVLAHLNDNALARIHEEQDLIARINPPLNTQHRTNALPGLLGHLGPRRGLLG